MVLNLKILDPACGSGAFLNQALEFLINDMRNYKKILSNLDILHTYEIEQVFRNNLYGRFYIGA